MAIVLTMLVLGTVLGFIGAGGSGFIIAFLTLLFKVPIHVALATSLTAMAFTSLSGAFSHYREGNVSVKAGVFVGIFGAFGAFGGSKIASLIQEKDMHYLTAGMLFLSGIFLLFRLFYLKNNNQTESSTNGYLFVLKAALVLTENWSSVFICSIFRASYYCSSGPKGPAPPFCPRSLGK